jgi:hypothetical protein
MQAAPNANILLRYNLAFLAARCSQAALIGIGFVPVTNSVDNTNPWTGLGSACLAGAPAGSEASEVAAAGRQLMSNVDLNDLVSTQAAEINAVYNQTCVKGVYAVTVQAPEAAGCYYFVLRLADGSRQIIVLRVTGK